MQRQRGLQQTRLETMAGSGEEPEAKQGRNPSGTMIRLKRRFSTRHGTSSTRPWGPLQLQPPTVSGRPGSGKAHSAKPLP